MRFVCQIDWAGGVPRRTGWSWAAGIFRLVSLEGARSCFVAGRQLVGCDEWLKLKSELSAAASHAHGPECILLAT